MNLTNHEKDIVLELLADYQNRVRKGEVVGFGQTKEEEIKDLEEIMQKIKNPNEQPTEGEYQIVFRQTPTGGNLQRKGSYRDGDLARDIAKKLNKDGKYIPSSGPAWYVIYPSNFWSSALD